MSLKCALSPTKWSISFLMLEFCARVALKLIITPSSLFSSSMIRWLMSFFSLAVTEELGLYNYFNSFSLVGIE